MIGSSRQKAKKSEVDEGEEDREDDFDPAEDHFCCFVLL